MPKEVSKATMATTTMSSTKVNAFRVVALAARRGFTFRMYGPNVVQDGAMLYRVKNMWFHSNPQQGRFQAWVDDTGNGKRSGIELWGDNVLYESGP